MLAEVAFMRQSLDLFNKEDDVKTRSIFTRFCIDTKITINSCIFQVFSAGTLSSRKPQRKGGGTIDNETGPTVHE